MNIKGFSLHVMGANSGIQTPLKALTNMPIDLKYKNIFEKINNIEFIETQFKEFVCNTMFQGLIKDSNKLYKHYMTICVINNLDLLDVDDKNGKIKIISNTNMLFSYYPYITEYSEDNQKKMTPFFLEIPILERISYLIYKENLSQELVAQVFLELINVIKYKTKGYKSKNPILESISDLKLLIINDEILNSLLNDFYIQKIHTNVNKQGSDTFNNIFYHSPMFLSQMQVTDLENSSIENYKLKLSNILETSISSIHPITYSNLNSNKVSSKECFMYINHYKRMINILDIDTKGSIYSLIVNVFLKMSKKDNKIIITIKQLEKEVLMKTQWFSVGEQISKGIISMHSNKKGPDLYKAMASTKEELINTISMKNEKMRSSLIIKKYLVKFQLSTLFINNPEELLEMNDDGLKEFILGLYCKKHNEGEK